MPPDTPPKNITPALLLIGLRGSGKSTLGTLVAERLTANDFAATFADLDHAVLDHLGCDTVADAWNTLGEPAFRAAETACLRECLLNAHNTPDTHTILALGGGTPTAPGASKLLRDARDSKLATIVYLRAQPDTLRARLQATDPNRPPLTGNTSSTSSLDEIDAIFAARDPLYRELSSEVIEIASDTTIDALVDRLVQLATL